MCARASCFYLTLACESAVAPPPPRPAPMPEPAARANDAPLHVLIVDDHEVNRRIVSLFIQPLGWAWTMAESGAEALRQCRDQVFDVILMDMQMPGMDGITATRNLRTSDGPNRTTPVVALTANALEAHRSAWAETGVHTVLTKPIDPDLLVSALASHAALGWQSGMVESEAVSA
ncbi:MAG: response regulator [Asticcacaulis sp.]